MKSVYVEHADVKDASEWCLRTLGPETAQWWTTQGQCFWDGTVGVYNYDMWFHFDVIEDNEKNLTFFLLKWSQ